MRLVVSERVKVGEVFRLAKKLGLTVYDAGYIWLAKKLKVELLTHDKKMREAAVLQ